jgi:hypothetical protein
MKTSELTGAALDWAVARCEGIEIVSVKHGRATFIDPADDGALNEIPINYSTDWAQGGPIIEYEKIGITPTSRAPSFAWAAHGIPDEGVEYYAYGPTPLIAAMRVYVASKLGDEVEIPEEFKKGAE